MRDIWEEMGINWIFDEKTGKYTHYEKRWFVLFTKWNSEKVLEQPAILDYDKALKVYNENKNRNFIVELKEVFDEDSCARVIKSNKYKWSDIEIQRLIMAETNNG